MALLIISSVPASYPPIVSGLDNNWIVRVSGLVDDRHCVRVSSITDLGSQVDATGNESCVDPNLCGPGEYDGEWNPGGTKQAVAPASFGGCTLNEATAKPVVLTGFIADTLCHHMFIAQQKDVNCVTYACPGTAPDGVYLRTSMPQHTRACLTVDYCAETGYTLVHNVGSADAPSYECAQPGHTRRGRGLTVILLRAAGTLRRWRRVLVVRARSSAFCPRRAASRRPTSTKR